MITNDQLGGKFIVYAIAGKRSSKEFLERKGIYKDEPIFGNTLREIKNRTGCLVPPFITEVIRLLEIPENIQSLGNKRGLNKISEGENMYILQDFTGHLEI